MHNALAFYFLNSRHPQPGCDLVQIYLFSQQPNKNHMQHIVKQVGPRVFSRELRILTHPALVYIALIMTEHENLPLGCSIRLERHELGYIARPEEKYQNAANPTRLFLHQELLAVPADYYLQTDPGTLSYIMCNGLPDAGDAVAIALHREQIGRHAVLTKMEGLRNAGFASHSYYQSCGAIDLFFENQQMRIFGTYK